MTTDGKRMELKIGRRRGSDDVKSIRSGKMMKHNVIHVTRNETLKDGCEQKKGEGRRAAQRMGDR